MTDQTDGAVADVKIDAPADTGPMSAREAGRFLASLRKPKETESAPERAETQPEQQPSPPRIEGDDAAPPLEAPGETQAAEPEVPEELPDIEPPRSWTKEARERWSGLPRETQEYLADREQERDREVRRSQNEAAEKLKGLTAKEQAVEQARQQYESALPILLQNLQTAMAGEFSDIKTMADVQTMAANDWPKYIRWDAAQKQAAAVQQEILVAQQRQDAERRQKWGEYAGKEDKALADKVVDMRDPEKASKLQKQAMSYLEDIGFTQDELVKGWNSNELSLRDHRVQMLILDGMKWRDAQAARAKVQAKPIPPAQRPGTTPNRGAQAQANIQNLTQRLEKATGNQAARIGAELLRARRAAAR